MKFRSDNNGPVLYAVSSISGEAEYVTSTNHILDTTGGGGGGGGNGAILDFVTPTIGATVLDLASANPLTVAITDGSGNQITSFGGGTQYAELTTTAPGTGTLSLGRYKSSAPTLTDGQMYAVQLDASGNLKVNIAAGSSSGQQYADGAARGTATGTLAMIDDGTNIQSAKGDSDGTLQTNNTKVGGTAIDTNSGNKSAGTQRVVLATDQPAFATAGLISVKIDQTTPGTTNLVALTAETTKVIGVTRSADGSGNLLTSTTNALDVNLKTSSISLSSNLAQVNGATVNVGVGAAGTGTQRVTTSTDSTIGTVTTVSTVTAVTNVGTIGTSVTPGTAAANLGKARDSVAGGTDTGVATFSIRRDAPTAVTPAAGDYEVAQIDARGSAWVHDAPATTPTLANVAGSVTSVTALAANTDRRMAVFYNDSTSDCRLKFGATASATDFTIYLSSLGTATFNGSDYSGLVSAIWVSATGSLRVTETAA